MHVVFINQYYPPDVAPTGVLVKKVAEEIAAWGHQVTVICGTGGYGGTSQSGYAPPEGHHDVTVRRMKATRFGRHHMGGKILDYLSFYALSGVCLMRMKKPDVVISLTTPPYLSVLGRIGSFLRGAKHSHWLMDLYPDVLDAHGAFKRPFRGHTLLRGLAKLGWGGRRNIGVLTLGPDMRKRAAKYISPSVPQTWVPLWGTTEELTEPTPEEVGILREKRGWESSHLVLMYSGNMGLGHRFSEFLEVSKMKPENVRFAFFGRGKRRTEIEAFQAKHPGIVELHDYVKSEDLAAHLRSADVHLVSLEPSWDGAMVPSKLQGIFAAGRPVIFVGSRTSSTGRWIIESGAGWVIAPGDIGALGSAIKDASDPVERDRRGRLARDYALLHFDARTNARASALFLLGEPAV
jgi:colanic acid biosynthesis glycosyl transferase WcaI